MAALLPIAALLFVPRAAAVPVPIGRLARVPFGFEPGSSSITPEGDRRRSLASGSRAPERAPRRVAEVRAGGGRLLGPILAPGGEVWIGAGDGLARFDALGQRRQLAPIGLVSAGPCLAPGGGVVLVARGSELISLDRGGHRRATVELPSSVGGSPLVLDDGTVVVATRGGALLRYDESLRQLSRRDLEASLVRPPALAPGRGLWLAAGSALLLLDERLATRASVELDSLVVAGPAVTPAGEAWAVTRGRVLWKVDAEGGVQVRRPLGEQRLVGPTLGVASDGSPRLSAMGLGLLAFEAEGAPRFAKPEAVFARGFSIDPDGAVLGVDEERRLWLVDRAGTTRWTAALGLRPWSAPVLDASGTLYFLGRRGRLSIWR